MEVPEHLEADVSGMHIGDTLRLSSLTPPAGVTLLDDLEETVLATVTQPTRVEEPEERSPRAKRAPRALPRAKSPREAVQPRRRRVAATASPVPTRAKPTC